MITIIFFVLLLTGYMLYYMQFTLNYLMHKYYHPRNQPEKQTVQIIQSKVSPQDFKMDFLVDEYDLKHRVRNSKTKDEKTIIRELAAHRLEKEIYDLVVKDINNDLFELVEYKERFDDYSVYGRSKRCSISFRIVPTFKNRPYCGDKLI